MSTITPEQSLQHRYRRVRQRSAQLCAPLATEDHVPQPAHEVSPPKWQLGHTAWLFEALVLQPLWPGFQRFHPMFGYVFNSYYEGIGAPAPRRERGSLSRPTLTEALACLPDPGFARRAGATGEYNGMFMVNQQVLRGASFATPPGNARSTYRNFFRPSLRWQYTGIRPARVASGGSPA